MPLPEHAEDAREPMGLVLLTGGQGLQFGAPKHSQFHPGGRTWGGHLIHVFEEVYPEGPICVLGQPVPDRPELGCFADFGHGPARAITAWAKADPPPVSRWWVLPCDQVRWTAPALKAWSSLAAAVDPQSQSWVMAEHEGHIQYLGGFLGATLLPAVVASPAWSMKTLTESLPGAILLASGPEWLDVDNPEDLRAWRA